MNTLLMPSRYSLRRLATVWAVTLMLHAAALFAAGWIAVARQRPVELIRISLRPGGGGGGGHPAPKAPLPSAPPPVEAAPPVAPPVPPPAVVVPPVTKPHPAAVPRPPARKRPQRAAPRQKAPPAAPAPQLATKPAPGVGAGEGSGLGTGTGAGMGSGSGTGTGSGSGNGEGAGMGSGADADQRAFCVYCPEPGYPLLARRRGWRGSVDVSLVLLADGRVQSASVHRSSGYSILDEEAVTAARRSRFQLAQGVTAPVRGRIEYRFELRP